MEDQKIKSAEVRGTDLIVMQSLSNDIRRLHAEMTAINSTLNAITQGVGEKLLGKQEGNGLFQLIPGEAGSVFVAWIPQAETPKGSPQDIPQEGETVYDVQE